MTQLLRRLCSAPLLPLLVLLGATPLHAQSDYSLSGNQTGTFNSGNYEVFHVYDTSTAYIGGNFRAVEIAGQNNSHVYISNGYTTDLVGLDSTNIVVSGLGYIGGHAYIVNSSTLTFNGGTIGKLYQADNAHVIYNGGSVGPSTLYQSSGGTSSGYISVAGVNIQLVNPVHYTSFEDQGAGFLYLLTGSLLNGPSVSEDFFHSDNSLSKFFVNGMDITTAVASGLGNSTATPEPIPAAYVTLTGCIAFMWIGNNRRRMKL